jgi:hypothetical protein
LLAPDETTRAMVDLYTRTSVLTLTGPLNQALLERARALGERAPSAILAQEPGRTPPRIAWLARYAARHDAPPVWAGYPGLRTIKEYALPNGRRYALLEIEPAKPRYNAS